MVKGMCALGIPLRRYEKMEEKELVQRLHEIFEATMPALENISKGFLTQDQAILKKGEQQFAAILSSNLSSFENVAAKEQKDEVDKRFLGLLIPLQNIALAVRNLAAKKKAILSNNIMLSVKAVMEITELSTAMIKQFRDTKDFILTRNPVLKDNIRTGMERIIEMADEAALMHEGRLITGACMPKTSYLYLPLIASYKRIAEELVNFSEMV
jgi:Na+/phosphate symporter